MNKDYEEYLINLRDKINSYDTPEADFDALIRLNDAGAYIRDLENNYKMIINEQIKKQKEVIDKAIGYIDKNSVYFAELHKHGNYFINVNADKLLDILKEVEKVSDIYE